MNRFTNILKVLAVITIAIGIFHEAFGLRAEVILGADLSEATIDNPVLDSQNRFYGVIFICYGVLVFLSATDLPKYVTVFRILAGFLFLGGIARLFSIAQVGMPSMPIILLMLVELIVPPILLWWHNRLSKQSWPITPE